jgi:hypothetical protein
MLSFVRSTAVTRLLQLASWLSCMLMLALLVACGGSATPSAQQLLTNAEAAIQKAHSYHFNLQVDHAGQTQTLLIQKADGDLVVPDRLQANATAQVLGSVVQVKIIVVGQQQYMTDPISGRWESVTGLPDPRALSDSRTGIAALLAHIQNPSSPSDSSVDGVACWSINGKLDARYLSSLLGDQVQAGSQLAATTCIGKSDQRPYLIRLTGVATAGDSDQTVRTLKLSKFDEQVAITAPTL